MLAPIDAQTLNEQQNKLFAANIQGWRRAPQTELRAGRFSDNSGQIAGLDSEEGRSLN